MHADLDAVGWLLADALELLAPLGVSGPNGPFDRRELTAERNGLRTRLCGEAYIDAGRSLTARYCRAQSRKFDVAMLMIYPIAAPHRAPVVGAEWVVVGDRCHMIGFDVHPAGWQPELDRDLAAVYEPLEAVWRPALPPNQPLPPWAAELARPWGVFTDGPRAILDRTRSAFRAYLGAAVERFYRPGFADGPAAADAPAVAAYKAHHYRHSPGRPLLARAFGPERADEFIAWHFGPAPTSGRPSPESAGCSPP